MPSRPPESSGPPVVSWLEDRSHPEVPLGDSSPPCLLVVFDGAVQWTHCAGWQPLRLQREDCLLIVTGGPEMRLRVDEGSALLLTFPSDAFTSPQFPEEINAFRDAFVWRVARILRGETLGAVTTPDGFTRSLVDALRRHLATKSACVRAPAEDGRRVNGSALHRAVVGMHEQMHERLRVDQLAESLGMESAPFGRGFKRRTGLSPSQYFVRMRVDCAKQMLAENRSVAETWLDCGFYDQAHLSRHFKRLVGVSPTQFLRSNAATQESDEAQQFS